MKAIFYLCSLSASLSLFLVFASQAHTQIDSLGSPTQFNNANAAYFSHLSLQGISFVINSPNHNQDNTVLISLKGLKENNAPISVDIPGKITGAEIADLNGDGFPEIYIYMNTNDPSKQGSLVAYGSNKNKSITPIYLPPLSDDPMLMKGYIGRDEFAVVENSLERRFPLDNQKNTYRQIQYKLKAGEAGWILTKTRVTDF